VNPSEREDTIFPSIREGKNEGVREKALEPMKTEGDVDHDLIIDERERKGGKGANSSSNAWGLGKKMTVYLGGNEPGRERTQGAELRSDVKILVGDRERGTYLNHLRGRGEKKRSQCLIER